MKYTILLLWGLLTFACNKNDSENSEAFVKHEAYLVNQLAVDGCGWHFKMNAEGDEIQVAASQKTQELVVDPFIQSLQNQNGLFNDKVEIIFRLTKNKRDVQCGWNKISSMDEIEVKEIKKI